MNHQVVKQSLCAAVFSAAAVGVALAQTTPNQPDAGSLLQQIERDRVLELPKRVGPRKEPLPQELKEVPGLTVTATAFRFAGNTIFTEQELAPLLADFLGKPLGFADLMRAADTIAEHYRKADWVVRVYLPKQDITQGVITIQIVEAIFGGAILEGEPPKRVPFAKLQAVIEAQQPVGELLRNEPLDRGLLLADDLSGVAVAGVLAPGARDGETAVAVRATDDPFARVDLTADNTASRSTGADRATAALSLASPFGFGDSASANYSYTEGSDYARVAYNAPVGTNGLRLGVNTSYLRYKVITDEFKSLNLKGDSQTYGLEISYPLVRTRLVNLVVQGSADRKEFENEQAGAVTSKYSTQAGGVGVYGNSFDAFGNGGSNTFNVFLNSGKLNNKIGKADQSFSKWRYGVSRDQVISDTVSLSLSLNGQESGDHDLDSSEKFSLGGASGVRAYPSGEASGASGQLINAELRWRLPGGVTLATFYDWGRVRDLSDTGPDHVTLKGAGLFLSWFDPKLGLSVRGTFARRDGDNPNPTAAGNDQDGSLKKNRFWLTASVSF